jgi:hypothetical protein
MSDLDESKEPTREELLQRMALIEAMISEGRRMTGRHGWIFVLWGVVNLTGIVWQSMQPRTGWVWPVVLTAGFLLQFMGIAVQRRRRLGRAITHQCREVQWVWSMMAVGLTLYVAAGIARHVAWQVSYIAAILTILGLANAISAAILRWRVQGVVAALWWLGAIAVVFSPGTAQRGIFAAEMFFGLVVFGLYTMFRERGAGPVARHA